MPRGIKTSTGLHPMTGIHLIPWNKGIPMTPEAKLKLSKRQRRLFREDGLPFTKSDYNKRDKQKNPERYKARKKRYHENNKHRPEYILAITLRKKILKMLGQKGNRASFIDFLGCSTEELRFYLEGKFKDGMTWDNHGLFGWHIDHVIPLAFFDLTKEDERNRAFHYTNLQPLWAQENLIKAAKINYGK